MVKIYVGNLNYRTTEDGLRELFGQFGEVTNSVIIHDRETGRSRGFGFVEMTLVEEAYRAIEELHGHRFEGRPLTVNEARKSTRHPKMPSTALNGSESGDVAATSTSTSTPIDSAEATNGEVVAHEAGSTNRASEQNGVVPSVASGATESADERTESSEAETAESSVRSYS